MSICIMNKSDFLYLYYLPKFTKYEKNGRHISIRFTYSDSEPFTEVSVPELF